MLHEIVHLPRVFVVLDHAVEVVGVDEIKPVSPLCVRQTPTVAASESNPRSNSSAPSRCPAT
jgi:hypothetical protein